jgi:hypothetical protein
LISVRGARDLGWKGVELGLREIGQAPEMRQARTLARSMEPAFTPTGPRILFLTPRDWAVHVQWEALIAQALRLRGADVRFLTCGGGLAICDRVNTYEGPPVPCHTCAGYTRRALASHALPVEALRDSWADMAGDDDANDWPELDRFPLHELRDIEHHGLPLGRLVEIPVVWFLCNSDLDTDPLAAITYRRFLRSARRIAMAVRRQFDDNAPDVLVILNGLFLFESIAAAVAEERGIRVVSYERGFIDGTLFFAQGPGACRYEIDHLWAKASARPLVGEEDERLDRYLADRRHGLRSFVQMWPNPQFASQADLNGADTSRCLRVVLFTNVTWDSAVQGRHRAFPSLQSWITDVIGQLGGRDDVQLIVRIHPAEVRIPGWETRESMVDVLATAIGPLPPNVRVVLPDDPLSSYSIMESADVGLVYTSTTGLELALMGKPVIVAGTTHYAGKGFTIDAHSAEEHRSLVDAVLAEPAAHRPDVALARRYAHLFFFDAVVAQPPVYEPLGGLARLSTVDLRELLPGQHAGLDAACSAILGDA